MSDIKDLQKKALEIRHRYDHLNKQKDGKAWNTEQLARGFMKDVTDLNEIIDGHKGKQSIEHELSDCLWSILVIAYKLGIDIEKSFWRTMAELDKRLDDQNG